MKTIDDQDRLDEVIQWAAQMTTVGTEFSTIAKWVLGYLLELRDRRESDLKPVSKFTQEMQTEDAILKQFKHIESEVNEAKYEVNSFIVDGCGVDLTQAYIAAIEIIDIQTSCESLLQLLGYDEKARRELRKKVIQKNTERGYFEE